MERSPLSESEGQVVSVEDNKAIALRFVREVLDGGNAEVEREISIDGAPRHFPGRDVKFDHTSRPIPPSRRSMRTEVHHLFGEGDRVCIHLTHHVVFGPDSRWATQAGVVDVFDREVQWNAMVVLRFQDGKIAEEWVVRDELQVLLQTGVVSSPLMSS